MEKQYVMATHKSGKHTMAFESVTVASQKTGITPSCIYNNILGNTNLCNFYKWEYCTEEEYKKYCNTDFFYKRVLRAYDNKGNARLEFENTKQACEVLGLNNGNLCDCILYNKKQRKYFKDRHTIRKTCGGFIWKYRFKATKFY